MGGESPAAAGVSGSGGANMDMTPPDGLPLVSSTQAAKSLAQISHIFTDLDSTMLAPGGTLLTDHQGRPSWALPEALARLKAAGVEVVIVTGRKSDQAFEFLRLLNLDVFVSEMGACVEEGRGAARRQRYLLDGWSDVQLASGLPPGVLPDGVTPAQAVANSGVVERLLSAFAGRLEPYRNHRMAVTHAFQGNVDTDAVAALLATERIPLQFLDNGVIHPVASGLPEVSEFHIYHLLPKGATKASAIATLMAERGLLAAQVLAVGDSVGDMAMGAHAGVLVAVANALGFDAVRSMLRERSCRIGQAFRTASPTVDGWVELAHAILAAKGG